MYLRLVSGFSSMPDLAICALAFQVSICAVALGFAIKDYLVAALWKNQLPQESNAQNGIPRQLAEDEFLVWQRGQFAAYYDDDDNKKRGNKVYFFSMVWSLGQELGATGRAADKTPSLEKRAQSRSEVMKEVRWPIPLPTWEKLIDKNFKDAEQTLWFQCLRAGMDYAPGQAEGDVVVSYPDEFRMHRALSLPFVVSEKWQQVLQPMRPSCTQDLPPMPSADPDADEGPPVEPEHPPESLASVDRGCKTVPGTILQWTASTLLALDPECASRVNASICGMEADVLGRKASTWILRPIGSASRQFGLLQHLRRAVGYPGKNISLGPCFLLGCLFAALSVLVRLISLASNEDIPMLSVHVHPSWGVENAGIVFGGSLPTMALGQWPNVGSTPMISSPESHLPPTPLLVASVALAMLLTNFVLLLLKFLNTTIAESISAFGQQLASAVGRIVGFCRTALAYFRPQRAAANIPDAAPPAEEENQDAQDPPQPPPRYHWLRW